VTRTGLEADPDDDNDYDCGGGGGDGLIYSLLDLTL
jgi:hypothetical protein